MVSLEEMQDLYLNLCSAIANAEEIHTLCEIEQDISLFKNKIGEVFFWNEIVECNSYYASLIMASNSQATHINLMNKANRL